jgi:L-aspartate oxidase
LVLEVDVRGEGAVLRNQAGERFMLDVHPDAELAPRDVVARGMAVEMAAQGGRPVMLDATALGAETLARRFPSIDAACRAHGLDWAGHPVPVTPAAHYWMGGVATDLSGRTSLAGLYAVGEVACTGVHGANRLASNSLLEGLVFARRAVDALPDGPDWNPDAVWMPDAGDAVLVTPAAPTASGRTRSSASAMTRRVAPSLEHGGARRGAATAPRSLREDLRGIAWEHLGLHRSADGLEDAAQRIDELAASHHRSPDDTDARACETTNLLELGRAIAEAALARRESRGAHFRTDHPVTSPEFAHRIAVVAEGSRLLETATV